MTITKDLINGLTRFLSEHLDMLRSGDVYDIYNRWASATDTDLYNPRDAMWVIRYILDYKDIAQHKQLIPLMI